MSSLPRATLEAMAASPDPQRAAHGRAMLAALGGNGPGPAAAEPGPASELVPLWLGLAAARCPWRSRPVVACGCHGCAAGQGDESGAVDFDVCIACQRARLRALPPPPPPRPE